MVQGNKKKIKAKIYAILSDKTFKDKKYSIKEIKRKLGNNLSFKQSELLDALEELIVEGMIMRDEKGLYRVFSHELGYLQGKLFIDEIGNGHVEITQEGEDKTRKVVYKIYSDDLNDALIGDIVLLKPLEGTSKGNPLARVEKIVKRNLSLVFCIIKKVGDKFELIPENVGFKHPIYVNKKEFESLEAGQRVLIKIGDLINNDHYIGEVANSSVPKEKTREVIQEEKKQQEYYDSKVLTEVVTTIYIDDHMDGIITLEDGSVAMIDPKDLMDALDGDLVDVQVLDVKRNGCYVASVTKVVERCQDPVICDIKKGKNGRLELIPCGVPFKNTIYLDVASTDKLLTEGDRVQVILGDYDRKEKAYKATFCSYVGNKDQRLLDLRTIAIENNINPDFPQEVLDEAETLPKEIRKEDRVGRVDLTDELIFSIDDETCKDRDDAISIKKLPNGNYQVGIHISDVSYYIKPGMALWEEAKKRSTSVYLSNIVIPMLPKIISNGICSLDEDKERLTLSTMVEVTPSGDILNYKFVDSIIKSKKAMTYTAVNQILEEGIVPEGYEDFVESLQMWNDLSKALERKKIARGYIDFGNNEIKPDYDADGEVTQIHKRISGSGQKLIENGMLLNGMCYAEFMEGVPAPFRVHDEPDEETLEQTFDLLEKTGIRVVSVEEVLNGKSIEKILKSIDDEDIRKVVANILLRSMKLARYSAEPGLHYGLGLMKYGQFTSPIRRFMDLLAHYMLKQKRDGKFNWKEYEKELKDIEQMCIRATKMERRAEAAERDADQYDMARYIDKHLDEKFEAQVTYINSKGIYIKTREGIDGKINTYDVDAMRLMYDETTASYRDRKNGIRIRIGDKLVATSLATDIEYKTINFTINEEDIPHIHSLKRKGH